MAAIDYQVIITMLSQVMIVAFPVAMIFMIVQKIVGIFISFVFGKEVDF